MALSNDKRWAFVDEDPDLDEEGIAARRQASDLKEQANALCHFVDGLPRGPPQNDRWREAVSMYQRAANVLLSHSEGRELPGQDKDLVVQCWLNCACLVLKFGDDATTERMCNQALQFDSENPHAALFLSRVCQRRNQGGAAEKWSQRSQRWARQRGEESMLAKAAEYSQPMAESSVALTGTSLASGSAAGRQSSELPPLTKFVNEGIAFLRQRNSAEAKRLLGYVIDFMDQEKNGGPIEQFTQRAPRALAFAALEGLSEAMGQDDDNEMAASLTARAALLLEAGPLEAELPFSEPDIFKREGLLRISMGHALDRAGRDPVPSWRRAVEVLKKLPDEPALEGHALLEFGTRASEEARRYLGNCDDCNGPLLEEAVLALDRAAERLGKARRDLLNDSSQTATRRRDGLAEKELKARTKLAVLWQAAGENKEVEKCVRVSVHLLRLIPDSPPPWLAYDLAELIRNWALVASSVARWQDAMEALSVQRHLVKILDGSGKGAADKLTEVETLKALAVVQRRVGDEDGIKETLASISALIPERDRMDVMDELRVQLRMIRAEGGETRVQQDSTHRLAVADAASAATAAAAVRHPEQHAQLSESPARREPERPKFGPVPPDPNFPEYCEDDGHRPGPIGEKFLEQHATKAAEQEPPQELVAKVQPSSVARIITILFVVTLGSVLLTKLFIPGAPVGDDAECSPDALANCGSCAPPEEMCDDSSLDCPNLEMCVVDPDKAPRRDCPTPPKRAPAPACPPPTT